MDSEELDEVVDLGPFEDEDFAYVDGEWMRRDRFMSDDEEYRWREHGHLLDEDAGRLEAGE